MKVNLYDLFTRHSRFETNNYRRFMIEFLNAHPQGIIGETLFNLALDETQIHNHWNNCTCFTAAQIREESMTQSMITIEELKRLDTDEMPDYASMTLAQRTEHIQFLQSCVCKAKIKINFLQQLQLKMEQTATADELMELRAHQAEFRPIELITPDKAPKNDPNEQVIQMWIRRGRSREEAIRIIKAAEEIEI